MFGQGSKGLVRYAEGMAVKLTESEAQKAVDKYRASYSKVYNLWASCQAAAMDAIDNPGKAFMAGKFIMLKVQNKALWMKLPSGRLICWRDPKIEDHLTPWGDMRTGVTVFNQNTYSRSWERNVLIGSSI